MTKWARDHLHLLSAESLPRFTDISGNARKLDDLRELRGALLDFIADFADWDNAAISEYLETSRLLTQTAHEALGGEPGSQPLLADPFAGGGAIPLEALRVGADVFASDLNPVAFLLNKVMLEYAPRYGQELPDEVRKWGKWIKEQADKELSAFYPEDPDGATPIAYLWARTVLSEAPGLGRTPIEVPLIRSFWLSKRAGHKRALRWMRDKTGRIRVETVRITYQNGTILEACRPLLEVFTPKQDAQVEPGTVARGAATCPLTGFVLPVARVREQLRSRRGGTDDARLFCVVTVRPGIRGRHYRSATAADLQAVRSAAEELARREHKHTGEMSLAPDESNTEHHMFNNSAPIYGMTNWGSLYTKRQTLALTTLSGLVREAGNHLVQEHGKGLARAVQTCLGLVTNKVAQYNSSLCRWTSAGENIADIFGRQAFPMVWDFAEASTREGSRANILAQMESHAKSLEGTIKATGSVPGQMELASATSHPLPDDSIQGFVTDPPYYYSVQYAGLSDFFYVWLKRTIGDKYPDLFRTHLSPRQDEIIVSSPTQAKADAGKNNTYYEEQMCLALGEGRRICCPDGIGVIVFAQLQTSAWEAFIQGLIDAGWTITASWPIDTEMSSRIIADRQSVLGSSIHIVCRPRQTLSSATHSGNIGNWRDVLSELPKRIHEWMPRLAQEGVVGADAIFACLGSALGVYSRYASVEKANGEKVGLGAYLEEIWAAVSREALNMIFEGVDASGFEEDARLTAMWLWTLRTQVQGGNAGDGAAPERSMPGYSLEYDAARKIAQGLGAHLENLSHLVEVKGSTAKLLTVTARTDHLFRKDPAQAPKGRRRAGTPQQLPTRSQKDLAPAGQARAGRSAKGSVTPGPTVLDRLHQSMILFAAGRTQATDRFLLEQGVGRNPLFWRLAQALSALYPTGTEEKRWVDGVLAKKRGLGVG